ncbi:hypothetical protein JKP88DRAFT_241716 [Tribonema minus]|uniref:Uncharacterized protein n=1 Tax=Tribonema minus TaxID=303371 RepID=A0A836CC72_9STRA|nr:hypothetical protein JKP88DRAFT_241716 [Tribonema minus]
MKGGTMNTLFVSSRTPDNIICTHLQLALFVKGFKPAQSRQRVRQIRIGGAALLDEPPQSIAVQKAGLIHPLVKLLALVLSKHGNTEHARNGGLCGEREYGTAYQYLAQRQTEAAEGDLHASWCNRRSRKPRSARETLEAGGVHDAVASDRRMLSCGSLHSIQCLHYWWLPTACAGSTDNLPSTRLLLPVVAVFDRAVMEQDVEALFGGASAMLELITTLGYESTYDAVTELHKKSIEPEVEEEGLVDRDCFRAVGDMISTARKLNNNLTFLGYGPPGSGKTVLWNAALKKLPGVLKLTFSGHGSKAAEWIETQVLDTMTADWTNKLKSAPDGDLGYDKRLITFVVVVAASRSAMTVPIDLPALRVKAIRAPDFTIGEAHELLRRQLPSSLSKLPDFPQLATDITEKVGTRPLYIMDVVWSCQFAHATVAEQCLEQVEAVAKEHLSTARVWVRSFAKDAVRRNGVTQTVVMAFLQLLSECKRTLTNDDAVEVLGFNDDGFNDDDDLLAALANNKAFVVDVRSKQVEHHSDFTKAAITQYINSNGTFSSVAQEKKAGAVQVQSHEVKLERTDTYGGSGWRM